MSPSFTLNFMVIENEGQKFVSVFLPGQPGRTARDDHPQFDAAVDRLNEAEALVAAQDFATAAALAQDAYDLIDVEQAISRRFEALSDRISVKDGSVYVDGDEVTGPLIDHIMAAFEAGEDFKPLVRFYEKLLTNPLGHAREALYPWIDRYGLTITDDGDVIGYKAFNKVVDEKTGEIVGYKPSRASQHPDRVNGVEVEVGEFMVVNPGDVVETPRSLVLHEPSAACGDGLHVGNFSYDFGWQCGEKFVVKFSPRDVVNVPNSQGKVRVCRYEIIEPATEQPVAGPIFHTAEAPVAPYEDVYDEDVCWECGDGLEDCVCDEDDYEDEFCECGVALSQCLDCEGEDAQDDETWLDSEKPTTDEIEDRLDELLDEADSIRDAMESIRDSRGRFGPGNGGRPDSTRDKSGRFCG